MKAREVSEEEGLELAKEYGCVCSLSYFVQVSFHISLRCSFCDCYWV
jgi:hypothetical protein